MNSIGKRAADSQSHDMSHDQRSLYRPVTSLLYASFAHRASNVV